MSIITIVIDTTKGDTLQGALHALMTTSRLEFPKYPDPKPTEELNEPNPFRVNGEAPGGVVKVELGAPNEAVQQLVKTFQDTNQPPLLGPKDGDRTRGEPGAGHRRRTNSQIAEDELYFAQVKTRGEAAIHTMELGTESPDTRAQTSDPLSAKSDAATTRPSSESANESLISSGAERTHPDDAQDAADEAAESAARQGGPPTLDDLRKVIGDYQKKFGMPQAAAKMLEYTGCPIFELPSKDIPLAIARWQTAIEHDKPEGAAKFTPVKTESGVVQGKPAPAIREEVNAAIELYAHTFDDKGSDSSKWVNTKADIPRIMERLFGAGKNNFNAIERTPENYGRVLASIQAEVGKNTFGRAPK